MKKLLLTAGVVLVLLPLVQAQGKPPLSLAGTSWKGTTYIPDPAQCMLRFGQDTVRMIYLDNMEIEAPDDLGGTRMVTGKDSASLEAMTYRLNGDTIELHKVWGGSPCGGEKGRYKIQTAGGKLKLVAIQDPCPERIYALKEEMTLVK
jgi:hypothetical protein